MTGLLAQVAQAAADEFPDTDVLTVSQDRTTDLLAVHITHGGKRLTRLYSVAALHDCYLSIAWFLKNMREEWDRA